MNYLCNKYHRLFKNYIMRNKIIFQVAMCVVALLSFVLPVSAQQSDETSEYEVALKKLMKVTGALNSIDEILPQTLAVARMNAPQKMLIIGIHLLSCGERRWNGWSWRYTCLSTRNI